MNIFLDTSVLWGDPFWKGNFAKQLLEASKKHRIFIFISDVVIRELRNNFEDQIDEQLPMLYKVNHKLEKLLFTYAGQILDKVELLLQFDEFYMDLLASRIITKLHTDNTCLQQVLKWSLMRRSPFFQGKKKEFNDAVIWSVYSNYCIGEQIDDCHFITANVNDFTDNNGGIHQELSKDFAHFKVYTTIQKYCIENSHQFSYSSGNFIKWLNLQTFTSERVINLLLDNPDLSLYELVKDHLNINILQNFHLQYRPANQAPLSVEMGAIAWEKCKEIKVSGVDDYAMIYGTLQVSVSYKIYDKSITVQDTFRTYYLKEALLTLDLSFNFIFDRDEIAKNVEVYLIEVVRERDVSMWE